MMGPCWLQVWRAPGFVKLFAPMQLYRTYGGSTADITSVDWTEDSFWITVASKDLTARCILMATLDQQILAAWLATNRLMHVLLQGLLFESCGGVPCANAGRSQRQPCGCILCRQAALASTSFAIDPRDLGCSICLGCCSLPCMVGQTYVFVNGQVTRWLRMQS